METKISNKPIRIINQEAIRLAKLRASHEGRSAANAVSQTIIEHLSGCDYIKNANAEQEESGGANDGSK